MKLPDRLPEAAMAACVLLLLGLLALPAPPAPLPTLPQRSGLLPPEPRPAARVPANPRPAPQEVAALFAAPRPAGPPAALKPAARPQHVPWLHFIAFVVGSTGETAYFFKNDQTGRVLMLARNQPREGWDLVDIQGDAWILENVGRRYLVTRR